MPKIAINYNLSACLTIQTDLSPKATHFTFSTQFYIDSFWSLGDHTFRYTTISFDALEKIIDELQENEILMMFLNATCGQV